MIKMKTKLAVAAALSAALLAGCGGDSGTADNTGGGGGGGTQTINSASVVDFIQQLYASSGENSEPLDVNTITLLADDAVDFTPII